MSTFSYTYAEGRENLYNTFWQHFIGVNGGVTFDATYDYTDESPSIEVLWEEVEPDEKTVVTRPTIYCYVRHYSAPRNHIGGESRQVFLRKGFFLALVLMPQDQGLKSADDLAYVVKSAFEGKRGFGAGQGITFKSVRVTEAGLQKGRWQTTVTADFEYSEVVSEG